jgi:hypothetical protein
MMVGFLGRGSASEFQSSLCLRKLKTFVEASDASRTSAAMGSGWIWPRKGLPDPNIPLRHSYAIPNARSAFTIGPPTIQIETRHI